MTRIRTTSPRASTPNISAVTDITTRDGKLNWSPASARQFAHAAASVSNPAQSWAAADSAKGFHETRGPCRTRTRVL